MADIFDQAATPQPTGDIFDQAAAPQQAAPTPPPSTPPAPPEGYATHYIKSLIDQTKQQWASGQTKRDAEMQVVKDVTESVKKGDFGGAAEMLLGHLKNVASNVYEGVKGGVQQDVKNITEPDNSKMLGTPIMPMPG